MVSETQCERVCEQHSSHSSSTQQTGRECGSIILSEKCKHTDTYIQDRCSPVTYTYCSSCIRICRRTNSGKCIKLLRCEYAQGRVSFCSGAVGGPFRVPLGLKHNASFHNYEDAIREWRLHTHMQTAWEQVGIDEYWCNTHTHIHCAYITSGNSPFSSPRLICVRRVGSNFARCK